MMGRGFDRIITNQEIFRTDLVTDVLYCAYLSKRVGEGRGCTCMRHSSTLTPLVVGIFLLHLYPRYSV
jgi:hypothetical protein